MTTLYDFIAADAHGAPAPLEAYRGQVLLIVNTASKCGFTPQYEGLEALHRKYHDQGLVVLGFPCNQFGGQEPGDANEIANFCTLTYDVTFPVLGKIDVNGPAADPLYAWLTHEKRGLLGSAGIKWNFTKFLIGKDGKVLDRFAPAATPASLEGAIEKALAA
jgi:glutathione peroxidase